MMMSGLLRTDQLLHDLVLILLAVEKAGYGRPYDSKEAQPARPAEHCQRTHYSRVC